MPKPPKKPKGPPYVTNEAGVPILTFIDPLVWREADLRTGNARGTTLDEASALKFFCRPESDLLMDIVDRYRAISKEEKDGPLVVPGMKQILDKMVWPLKNAKVNYATGNYLGTIALCGITAEMVTLLIFEVAEPSFNGAPLDGPVQEKLFGRKFEDLEQSRREGVLLGLGLLTESQRSHFGKVREIRRKHLHLFDYDPEEARADALTIFNRAYKLLFSIGPTNPERFWEIKPEFRRFLKKHGVPGPFPPPPPTPYKMLGPRGEIIKEGVAAFPKIRRRKEP